MGFDITYHPIREQEIQEWYFDAVQDISLIEKLAVDYHINAFYKDKYEDILLMAQEIKPAEFFGSCHGRYISVIQGFFRTYFYTRDSAFSFLIDRYPEFEKYTKDWADMIPHPIKNPVKNKITENYSSGVFIPADQVTRLLSGYYTDEVLRKVLNDFYSNGRISIFIKALEFSTKNGMGMLEATEVVEPNAFEFNNSLYYSDSSHCDQEGVFLYVEEAMKKAKKSEGLKNQSDVKIIIPNRMSDACQKKKGFWNRLFGTGSFL